MAQAKTPFIVFCVILLAAIWGVYLTGLNNDLVFDDGQLGPIMDRYGSLLTFKQRLLSYGSFVWIDSMLGQGWWKQRLLNITLHTAVVAALYALFRDLLSQTQFPAEWEQKNTFQSSRNAALMVGVALFAVNPMAVYAVGYLVQRSILMATLFSVLAFWLFVRGLSTGRVIWYVLALVSYFCAVLSKEHAVMTAALSVPLFIYVKRPSWKVIGAIAAIALLLLVAVTAAFLSIYSQLIGTMFDPRSVDFAQQLETLSPGISQRMYPLSVLNEAWLFFVYGFLWFFPNVMWMSLDLRPAFPLSYTSFPHIVGAVGYVALMVSAWWLLVRQRGVLSLVGLCLLFPLLLFATEFATVWVQDPLVLYRSYLWAMAIPGLIALVFIRFQPRIIYISGLVLVALFSALSMERVASMRDASTVWGDAAAKIDLQASANAVGRWRPFLNLGAHHLDRGTPDVAAKNFAMADALGDLKGSARFNMGVALQQQKKHGEALEAFNSAESKGLKDVGLYYHRGETLYALQRFPEAFENFSIALTVPPIEGSSKQDQASLLANLRMRRAETAVPAQKYDVAIQDFTELLKADPKSPRLLSGLGMAYIGKKDTTAALAIFDTLIASKPNAPAYYGRAMAHLNAGNQAASLQDMDQAIALDPRNPMFPSLRAKIAQTSAAKK